jgi:hypothetical protein
MLEILKKRYLNWCAKYEKKIVEMQSFYVMI